MKKVPFSGLFPFSFQRRGGGSHGRVRVTFTAAVYSSSWCCGSRRSGVCSVCLTDSLQGSEITVLCQKTLLSPPSSHIKPSAQASYSPLLRLYFSSATRSFDSEIHPLQQHLPPSTGLQGQALPLAPVKRPHYPTKSFYWPNRSLGSWREP